MLVYSADTFLIWPGLITIIIGGLLMILESVGTVMIGPISPNLHTWLLGFALVILGNSFFQAGIIVRTRHNLKVGMLKHILKIFNYENGILISIGLLISGLILDIRFLIDYLNANFTTDSISQSALFGLLLILLSAQTFTFTLSLELSNRLSKLE
jgi:hypothetical protein